MTDNWIKDEDIDSIEFEDYDALIHQIKSLINVSDGLTLRSIISLVVFTCPHCHSDHRHTCVCMKDE
jgi:hypothetical protein